jgi:hypothetical protein
LRNNLPQLSYEGSAVPEAEPHRLPYIPADTTTPDRDITHTHFAVGDRVVLIRGAVDGDLIGEEMTIVAPSWHTPTDENGWRVRNPKGGQHSYLTAHPRYLIHLERHCYDCTSYFRDLAEEVLPQITTARLTECGWYSLTTLDQLVHYRDIRGPDR